MKLSISSPAPFSVSLPKIPFNLRTKHDTFPLTTITIFPKCVCFSTCFANVLTVFKFPMSGLPFLFLQVLKSFPTELPSVLTALQVSLNSVSPRSDCLPSSPKFFSPLNFRKFRLLLSLTVHLVPSTEKHGNKVRFSTWNNVP